MSARSAGPADKIVGSGAPAPAPRMLRAAVRTWARRDRRSSGEAVLGVALDLIDAGSTPRREALGLLRTGMVLRVRGTRRDLAAAPWSRSAPLTITTLIAALAVFIAVIAGGWRALWSGFTGYGPSGAPGLFYGSDAATWFGANGLKFAAAGCLLAAVSALRGRRWIALLCVTLTGAAMVQTYIAVPSFPFVEVSFGHPAGVDQWGNAWWHDRSTSISTLGVAAVLGVLLGAVTTMWAVTGTRRGRKTAAGHDGAAASRRRTATLASRRSLTGVGAGLIAVIAAPTVATLVAGLILTGLRPAAETAGATSDTAAAPIVLLWLGAGAALVVALGGARRAPAAVLSALAVLVALWIPTIWTLFPLVWPDTVPLERTLGETAAVTVFWLITLTVFVTIALTVTAAAGRAERRRGTTPGSTTEPAGGPVRDAVA